MCWISVWLVVGASCTPGNNGVSPRSPSAASPTARGGSPYPLETTPANVVEAYPSPTVTHLPTATIRALDLSPMGDESDTLCIEQSEAVQFPGTSYIEAPEVILEFLNLGGTPDDLEDGLADSGIASVPRAVWASDMTGDGRDEVVVSIFNPDSLAPLPPGMLLIFQCKSQEFKLSFQEESGQNVGPPHLWYLEDLNGDRASELVISGATCGAHTCYEEVRVLAWETDRFQNILQGSAANLPTPDIRLLESAQPEYMDVEVASGGILSAGAGPQRTQVRRWSFDESSEEFEVLEDLFLPSDFRIHVLHDAEEAARVGDVETALLRYDQAARDTSLQDWMDLEKEQDTIGGYARFKIIQLHLRNGQDSFAEDVFAEMTRLYPDSLFTEMADLFMSEYSRVGIDGACELVRSFAIENESAMLTPLGSSVFGYTNPDFVADDVCF